ncbi:MAG: prepilin-type N-terminal cleavage/methylation domain-containing protein [Planctomycetes bacterium]|nr:prepilin-type N-terminal cleavage/methylation domain-containing protein [Planctomycetota bacterium]
MKAPASARRPRRAGFTLVELTIAMVVIVIGLLGLLSSMSYSARLNSDTEETAIALHGVRERLEVIEAAAFSSVAGLNGTTYMIDATNPNLDRLRPLPGNARVISVTVSQVVPGNGNFLEVTVRADWTGALGVRSLELRTRIASH